MQIDLIAEKIAAEVFKVLQSEKDQLTKDVKTFGYDPSYAKYCDHTVLRAYTPQSIVKKFCDEAKKYKVASICVNPIHVKFVRGELLGSGVKTCTVIGFPLGANTPKIKALEAADAIENGAEEVDMVINIGALRDANVSLVYEDIHGVVCAAVGKAKVKVIIETCYLTDEEKVRACIICKLAGADYVKTSTGFGPGGATVEDIHLMLRAVGDSMQVKASMGIDTREDAVKMIRAGASRLGVSRSPQIVEDNTTLVSASMDNKMPNRK